MQRHISTLVRTLPIVLAMALLVCFADTALACPTCKENLAGDPEAANIVRGYFYSILFMLSMPPLILSGLSLYFYYEVRKARAMHAKSGLSDGQLVQA